MCFTRNMLPKPPPDNWNGGGTVPDVVTYHTVGGTVHKPINKEPLFSPLGAFVLGSMMSDSFHGSTIDTCSNSDAIG